MTTPTYREERPWGGFSKYVENEQCAVKILRVNPGEKLSVQRHKKRDELWVGMDRRSGGIAHIQIQDMLHEISLEDLNEVWIPRGTIHSLENRGTEQIMVLEICFGIFDEDDIERLEDNYGRV